MVLSSPQFEVLPIRIEDTQMTNLNPDRSNFHTTLTGILEDLEEWGVVVICPGDPSKETDQQMLKLRVEGLAESVVHILPIGKIPPHKFPVQIVSDSGEHILTIEKDVTNPSTPYRLIVTDTALEAIWRDEAEEALYHEEVADRIDRGLSPHRFQSSPEDIELMKRIENEVVQQFLRDAEE